MQSLSIHSPSHNNYLRVCVLTNKDTSCVHNTEWTTLIQLLIIISFPMILKLYEHIIYIIQTVMWFYLERKLYRSLVSHQIGWCLSFSVLNLRSTSSIFKVIKNLLVSPISRHVQASVPFLVLSIWISPSLQKQLHHL